MVIQFDTVRLGAPALRNKTFVINNSGGLDDSSEIRNNQTLASLFSDLERTIEEIDLPDEISIIKDTGDCGKEHTAYLAIKKGGVNEPGDAALFTLTLNEKPALSEFKYGLVKHQSDRFRFTENGDTQSQDGFFRAGEIRTEFKKFLEFALPTISDWDLEYAREEFHSVCSPGGELSTWWANRVIASLAEGGQAIEIDGVEVDAGIAQGFAEQNMVRAVKLGPNTFELVSSS